MIQLACSFVLERMFLKVRANDFNRTMRMFCCQASGNMVIVMALFNVSQYTRMISLTPDYIYMMIEPVFIFISIHYLEMMIINSRFISSVYCSVPLGPSDEDATSVKDSLSFSCVSLSSLASSDSSTSELVFRSAPCYTSSLIIHEQRGWRHEYNLPVHVIIK